jgi:hypothetical protein
MIRAGRFRSKQQEDQVDRLVVDGIEVDGFLQPGEHAEQRVEIGSLAWGIATPWPIPVEPSRSRCSR